MTPVYPIIELLLILNIILGMLRIVRGPTLVDRVLAVQMFGTTGVAVLLVMAHRMDMAALRNAALIFGLLATLVVVAFVRLAMPNTPTPAVDPEEG